MALAGVHLRKAFAGSRWLVMERLTASLLNFFVGILIARYLGPEAFGGLSYAIAFIAVFSTIPYLGFAGVVVQELVRDRENQGEIIGTVIGAKTAAAVLAVALANVLAGMVVEQPAIRLLIFLISFSMLFDVGLATRLLFEARTDLKGVAVIGSFAAVATAGGRAAAVLLEAPLWVFAALVTLQSAIAGIGLFLLTRRNSDQEFRVRFKFERAKDLLRKSWPLIISYSTAIFYLKIDEFMLGQMLGMSAVGSYAVAARLSEVWYFIPTAIATAVFPRLIELRSSNPARYEERIKESARYLFWLSLVIAIPVSITAPLLVELLFGVAYRDAGLILAIHVWACPAVFMGKVIERWFIAEDLLKLLVLRQVLAAAVNVALNLILIPDFGGAGAAVATVISYTLAYYLSCFTSRRTAIAGRWMTEAMLWPVMRLRKQASR